MLQPSPCYTLPASKMVRWLTHAGPDVPEDIRARLIEGLFTSTMSLVCAAIVTMTINAVALFLCPGLPFAALLAADALLMAVRACLLRTGFRNARRGRPTPTDPFLLSSVAWAGLVGVSTALCLASREPVLQFLGPTAMMGIVGGIATRNNGAPRLAITQIVLCDVPMQLVIPFCGEPLMLISIVQCPLFILGLISTVHRLNRAYLAVAMAERDSEKRATHDTMTGVLNRGGLMMALSREIRSADRLALLYLDLDGFKGINDAFGHAAGDELLRQVAVRIASAIPNTCLLGRLGGDEFVVLAPGYDLVGAASLGESVVIAVGRDYDLSPGVAGRVGVSIGIAVAADDVTPDTLLADADAALYQAKVGGRGRCVLAPARGPADLSSNSMAA